MADASSDMGLMDQVKKNLKTISSRQKVILGLVLIAVVLMVIIIILVAVGEYKYMYNASNSKSPGDYLMKVLNGDIIKMMMDGKIKPPVVRHLMK